MSVEAVWAPTNEEYHAETEHVSHSMLKQFRKSRRDYYAIYEARTKAKPEPSDTMNLGTALHCAILEPGTLNERFAFAPECDRRKTDGKLVWQQFQSESNGKTVLTWKDREALDGMLSAVNRNDHAVSLLAAATMREHSIRCEHAETRQPIKARFDAVDPARPLVLDIKTAREIEPSAFARAMFALDYHCQAAWYADAYFTVYGRFPMFAFIAVRNCEPFSCAVYEVHEDDIELGREKNRRDLDALAACVEYDDWREDYEKKVVTLRLPKWAESQENDWVIT